MPLPLLGAGFAAVSAKLGLASVAAKPFIGIGKGIKSLFGGKSDPRFTEAAKASRATTQNATVAQWNKAHPNRKANHALGVLARKAELKGARIPDQLMKFIVGGRRVGGSQKKKKQGGKAPGGNISFNKFKKDMGGFGASFGFGSGMATKSINENVTGIKAKGKGGSKPQSKGRRVVTPVTKVTGPADAGMDLMGWVKANPAIALGALLLFVFVVLPMAGIDLFKKKINRRPKKRKSTTTAKPSSKSKPRKSSSTTKGGWRKLADGRWKTPNGATITAAQKKAFNRMQKARKKRK